MAEKSKVPDGSDYREAWAALDRDGRRRVRRAVNRGEALESRSEARVAVVLARSQRRFWRWGWAIGPVLVLALTFREGWQVALTNTGFVLLVVGGMAWFFGSRARRAEERNLELLERPQKGGGKRGGKGKAQPKGGAKGKAQPKGAAKAKSQPDGKGAAKAKSQPSGKARGKSQQGGKGKDASQQGERGGSRRQGNDGDGPEGQDRGASEDGGQAGSQADSPGG